MRTSRVAQETSRFFDTAAETLPRRSTRSSTRSSLAHFSYGAGAQTTVLSDGKEEEVEEEEKKDIEFTFGSDIEDAIVKTGDGASRSIARKRKRTATTTAVAAPRAPNLRGKAAQAVKSEIKSEIKLETKSRVKSEVQDLNQSAIDDASENSANNPRRRYPHTPARKRIIGSGRDATTVVEGPSDWEEMYELAKAMRISGPAANAAVDTMGCERLATPGASARDRRFHTLVALMLSSQTKDTVNAEAMARLKAELPPHKPGAPPGLNLENIIAVEPAVLNELIWKVGFHNNKTKYIKQAAEILRDQHNSDIPDTLEGLMALPGVGPKMAHLCMSADNGWGRVLGIGVDVHVHRITNLWGWQAPPSKTPEETRAALESWLPRDKWKEINWLLVGLGQKVCLPVGRKCGDCTLGLGGLCKAADRKKVNEGRRRLELELEREVKVEVKVEAKAQDDAGGGLVVIKKEVEEEVDRQGISSLPVDKSGDLDRRMKQDVEQ
ncbi:DNA glycosylase [Cercophora scortea]|uniref:Endonuclease III homolog n=1 Tax=Cercophora scortea TaxID=314031 RepID=A0AAE0INA8_9PEZI|nr:DNA glycosylase [Cercophora scortea]